jgi:hypothetical protein
LSTGYCPQVTAHRILPTGYCPQDTVYMILSTGYCPNYLRPSFIAFPHNFFAALANATMKQSSEKEQDSQCTYKVTMRRIRATIVAMEK